MDARLSKLISDYLCATIRAVEHMKASGIARPSSNQDWAMNGMPKSGVLNGEIPYRKHGYGCEVMFPNGAVDFDFGPGGETNGFDLWRLSKYCENDIQKYGFCSVEEMKQYFEVSIQSGEVRKMGNLYFMASHAG